MKQGTGGGGGGGGTGVGEEVGEGAGEEEEAAAEEVWEFVTGRLGRAGAVRVPADCGRADEAARLVTLRGAPLRAPARA